MDINDYGYKPEKNMLLAMFDTDLKTYDGKLPINGQGAIAHNVCPEGSNSSLHIENQNYLLYDGLAPLGISDFTIDFYMRYQSGDSGVSSVTINGAYGFCIHSNMVYVGGNRIGTYGIINSNSCFSRDAWIHYALVREKGTFYYFVNGLFKGQAPCSYNLASKQLIVNAEYTNGYYGGAAHYKAVRLCNFARWTSTFIPPRPVLVSNQYLYLRDKETYGMREV